MLAVPAVTLRIMTHVDLDGVELTIPTQRKRVIALTSPGLRLALLPSGLMTLLGRLAGGRDVIVGDRAFDRAFMIKADDAALALAWLGADVRRALLATEGISFVIRDGTLTAEPAWGEVDGHFDPPQAMMAAVAQLARASARLADGWRSAATRLGGELGALDAFPAVGVGFDGWSEGTPVRVGCEHAGEPRPGWCTVVRHDFPHAVDLRCTLTPRTAPGTREIVIDVDEAHEALVRSMITPTVNRLTVAVDAPLTVDGAGVSVTWPGCEPDGERLHHAAALVAAWATVGAGDPYR